MPTSRVGGLIGSVLAMEILKMLIVKRALSPQEAVELVDQVSLNLEQNQGSEKDADEVAAYASARRTLERIREVVSRANP